MASILDAAKNFTIQNAERLIKDTGYIPKEKLAWCPMGCAKTAAQILAEVAGTNTRIAAKIRGEKSGTAEEEFARRVQQASTLEEYSQLVRESAKVVSEAIDCQTEADLDKQIQMPWGAVFSLAEAVFLPASHMNYHDGQINYIQLLLGDDKFHWAE